jgi:hypothetical protein
MASPYLCRMRPTRETVEQLIANREAKLSRISNPAERRRIERELVFLREELGRLR